MKKRSLSNSKLKRKSSVTKKSTGSNATDAPAKQVSFSTKQQNEQDSPIQVLTDSAPGTSTIQTTPKFQNQCYESHNSINSGSGHSTPQTINSLIDAVSGKSLGTELNGESFVNSEVDRPALVDTPTGIPSADRNSDDDFPATQILDNRVLKNVVAYVEVRSTNDNRSEAIRKELEQLGATVVKKFTDDVTHVIFKEGSKRTQNKATKNSIHMVSVLWVDSCKQYQEHVSERLYPAILPKTSKGTPLFMAKLKKAKSMQPSNFEDEVANSAERCNKKKKNLADRLQSTENTPQNSPNLVGRILVQETQPRTPIDMNTPIRLLIPDTPPSMREKLKQLKAKESNTPVIETEEEPLQRRLFTGMPNASFDSADVDHLVDGLKDEIDKCLNSMPESPIPTTVMGSPKNQSSQSKNSQESAAGKKKSPKNTKRRKSIASAKFVEESEKPKKSTSRRKSVAAFTLSKQSEDVSDTCTALPEKQSSDQNKAQIQTVSAKSKINTPPVPADQPEEEWNKNVNKKSPDMKASRRKSIRGKRKSVVFSEQVNDCNEQINIQDSNNIKKNQQTGQSFKNNELAMITEESNANNNSLTSPPVKKQKRKSVGGRRKSIVRIEAVGSADNTRKSSPTVVEKQFTALQPNVSKHDEGNKPCNDSSDDTTDKKTTGKDTNRKKGPPRTNSKKKLLSLTEMEPDIPLMSKTPDYQSPLIGRKRKLLSSTSECDSSLSALFPNKPSEARQSRKGSISGKSSASNNLGGSDITMTDDLTLICSSSNTTCSTTDLSVQETTIHSSTTQNENSMSAVFGESMLSSLSGRIAPRPSIDEFNLNRNKHFRKPKPMRHSDSDSSDNSMSKKLYRRSPPSRPSLVMTSLHAEEQDLVISVVKTLGKFVISDNVTDSTTHLICGGPRRTLNVLYGIMKGIWILHKQWVLSSIEACKWLPEEDFEVRDYFPVVRIAREGRLLHKENYRPLSFKDVGTIYIAQKTSPPRQHLINLLKICGAKVINNPSRADIYMGHEFIPDKTCVNPVWILDCITQQQVVDVDRYLLGRPKRESSPEF